ncbi:fatty acid desaturase family protein [Agarilytica rhodophyticola]|uniref:fatty acid desaturase family protein n=1 Tax=Agarilytica rhodophyticola TaxID=1737490 RepID=UPI000B345003|nr:fatty acid desaturase [Agarilytica rhodophyticola]
MSTTKNRWHQLRAQRALREWKIELPKRHSKRTVCAIFFTTGLQFLLCYLSTHMSLLNIIIMAYIVGAFLCVYIFSNCHEICHNLVHPFFSNKTAKNILLRFASLPDISSGNYFYYKWGHISHHRFLGEHSIDEIIEGAYERPLDLDPITHLRNMYLFRNEKDGTPVYRFEKIRDNKWLRAIVLFGMPVIDTLKLPMLVPSRIKLLIQMEKSGRSTERIKDALSQDFIVLLSFFIMYLIFGNFNFLLYLYASHLFYKGFMHPYLFLWVGIHKSGKNDEDGYQPTSSIYAKFSGFLSGGINYHIEHHDFPGIPRNQLRKVNKKIPQLYNKCFSFKSYREIINYLKRDIYDHSYHLPLEEKSTAS